MACEENSSHESSTNSVVDLDSSPEKFEKLSLESSSENQEANFDESFQELAMIDVFDSSCDESDARDFMGDSSRQVFNRPSSDSEEEAFGSREEREKWSALYEQQVADSDGFDVDDFNDRFLAFGMIIPIPEHQLGISSDFCTGLKKAVELGMKIYNKDHATNYEVVEVEKVNVQGVAGVLMYITFKAKDGDTENTFQALVHDGIPRGNMRVCFCRLKGDKQKGDWTGC